MSIRRKPARPDLMAFDVETVLQPPESLANLPPGHPVAARRVQLADHRKNLVAHRHDPCDLGDVALDAVFPCRSLAELSTLDDILGGDQG